MDAERRPVPGRGTEPDPPDQALAPETARWFAKLAAYTPAMAFVRNGDGRYLWVNAAYAHLYGLEPAAVVGRSVEEVDPPLDAAGFRALDREVLRTRRPVRHMLAFRHPDGRPGRAVGHRFALDGRDEPCVGGVYVDVTERDRALDEKAAVHEELHALRERSGLAVVTVGLDGRVERASGGAAGLLGVGRADLEGTPVTAHLKGSAVPAVLRRLWSELVQGRISRAGDVLRVRVAGGATRLLRTDLAVVRHRGAPVRVLAVLTPLGTEFAEPPRITPLQLRVLLLLAGGRPNSDIAEGLGLSRQALDYHLRRLRSVLDAPSRPAMVARAYTLGILDANAWPPRPAAGPPPGR
ncbi:PAS domain-containing protein [Kitasatospora sp. NPDC048540]|uniref:PAS domain-containing protein n=1 Tax=Kitasatospora sp. NPDC048540 TaxID=3155634 RepID=UPI003405090A